MNESPIIIDPKVQIAIDAAIVKIMEIDLEWIRTYRPNIIHEWESKWKAESQKRAHVMFMTRVESWYRGHEGLHYSYIKGAFHRQNQNTREILAAYLNVDINTRTTDEEIKEYIINYMGRNNWEVLTHNHNEKIRKEMEERNRIEQDKKDKRRKDIIKKFLSAQFIATYDFLELAEHFEYHIPPASKGAIKKGTKEVMVDGNHVSRICTGVGQNQSKRTKMSIVNTIQNLWKYINETETPQKTVCDKDQEIDGEMVVSLFRPGGTKQSDTGLAISSGIQDRSCEGNSGSAEDREVPESKPLQDNINENIY